jgi:2-polyprenyl-3-methyl-5-hydroxy-6-metoxy-1,4-benzoquinol methylase
MTMSAPGDQAHWERVYGTKDEQDVSWFEERPQLSLDLIRATGVASDAALLDIGGGASRLADTLLDLGFTDVTVLDLSAQALASAKARLGARADQMTWIVADVTAWTPPRRYDVWHDRAAFHFLTAPADQAAYADRVGAAVKAGGHVIIGTFALDGPERCSGLPVMRHDAASIGAVLGASFALAETRRHAHKTPWGATQSFQFSRFRRAS